MKGSTIRSSVVAGMMLASAAVMLSAGGCQSAEERNYAQLDAPVVMPQTWTNRAYAVKLLGHEMDVPLEVDWDQYARYGVRPDDHVRVWSKGKAAREVLAYLLSSDQLKRRHHVEMSIAALPEDGEEVPARLAVAPVSLVTR